MERMKEEVGEEGKYKIMDGGSSSFLRVNLQKHLKEFDLDISFTAGQGILGILGASGSGKSMTLKSVAGIVTPDRGSIVLGHTGDGDMTECVFYDSDRHINLRPRKRKVG